MYLQRRLSAFAYTGLILYTGLHVKYHLFLSDFNETWIFSPDFHSKKSNTKFHENPSTGYRVCPCGLMDMTKLIVAVANFANASIKIIANNKGDTRLSQLQNAKRVNELALFADMLYKAHGSNRA